MKRLTIAAFAAAAVVAVTVGVASGASSNGPGCVDKGKGFVGAIPGDPTGAVLNWHGTYVISLCPGATGPQAGDSNTQEIKYPDGTTERYKIVYSTADLAPNGVFCYWDLTLDPTLSGTGYHCPAGSGRGHLYWYIVASAGDSPFLEPAGSGGTKSRPTAAGCTRSRLERAALRRRPPATTAAWRSGTPSRPITPASPR